MEKKIDIRPLINQEVLIQVIIFKKIFLKLFISYGADKVVYSRTEILDVMQITTNKSDKTLNWKKTCCHGNRYFLIDKKFFELQNKIGEKNMKFEVTMTWFNE